MTTKDSLLLYLKKHKNRWVSGEHLSHKLAVSRAAVNKHIRKLREDGYHITSSTKKGYCFQGAGDLLIPAEIQEGLKTRIFGKPDIISFDNTDSTNIQARLLAEKGAPEGTLVLAEKQTSGRGRKGRTWFSPPGRGIYASLILRPAMPPSEVPGITLITAVAAAESLIALTKLPIKIKWPNDLLINSRKLAGILTEISTEMDAVNYIIVGIGLNINTPPEDFPEEIKPIATSVLAESGKTFSRVDILQAFIHQYEACYDQFKQEGFTGLRKRWKALTDIIGRNIKVEKVDATLSGQVVDVDNDGVLILKDNKGQMHRVFSGDVIL